MEITISLVMGYLLGSLSPAALFSRIKRVNLRRHGTGNLGATNTMLTLGKGYGVLVMVLDIGKAYLASLLAGLMFPQLEVAGLLAGAGAVVGHVFPFYMKFRGGKGLAAFGGMVLAYDPRIFLLLLILGVILMLAVNYSIAMPLSASVLLPVLVALGGGSLTAVLICAAVSVLIGVKHWSNLGKALRGEDKRIRDFVRGK